MLGDDPPGAADPGELISDLSIELRTGDVLIDRRAFEPLRPLFRARSRSPRPLATIAAAVRPIAARCTIVPAFAPLRCSTPPVATTIRVARTAATATFPTVAALTTVSTTLRRRATASAVSTRSPGFAATTIPAALAASFRRFAIRSPPP
ncbi:hypothetical protein [Phytoactinopolyspora halotolerans]|uniref:Uncharacterized protein n=1 Tax=Phytoactinopolyspora halotolerans TaxID=1981512 RepID=A0A6L9SKP4_9ACTN|nr:hypothetical protein [Phytoactinopolyspora halotolerans]NEE04680.1 hypothetical protein [Phytoactinopolyspora halotolerans]